AALIKSLGREIGVPVVIIAHHYRHLIDVADRVLVLDPRCHKLVELPADAGRVERELEAIGEASGEPVVHAGAAPDAPARATAIVSVSAGPMRSSTGWRMGWALR